MCKSCCAERDRKHYLKNKEQYYQRAKNVWEHRRAFTLRYKKMFGKCVDCGIDDWRVLQFDHVRGKKLGVISDLYSYKMSTLKEEIRKCDFRCANCHQIKTHFS